MAKPSSIKTAPSLNNGKQPGKVPDTVGAIPTKRKRGRPTKVSKLLELDSRAAALGDEAQGAARDPPAPITETTTKKKRGRPSKARKASSSPSRVAGEQQRLINATTPNFGLQADSQAISTASTAEFQSFNVGPSRKEIQVSPTLEQPLSTSSVQIQATRGDGDISAGMKRAVVCYNTVHSVARLEDLPSELIEMIFLESLNLSLPRASRRLGLALSSNRIKIALVTAAFTDKRAFQLHPSDSPNWSDSPAMVVKLQSEILKCRWMTWDFMKIYFEAAITKTILREFELRRDLRWDGGKPATKSLVRSYVRGVVYRNVNMGVDALDEVASDNVRPSTGQGWNEWRQERKRSGKYPQVKADRIHIDAGENILDLRSHDRRNDWRYKLVTSTLVARSWTLDNGLSKIALAIGPRTGLVLIGSSANYPQARNKIMSQQSNSWRSLECFEGPCQIPAKLLTGPWTDDGKLNFLEALLDAGAYVIDDDHKKLAEQGLMDAIKEDNYRAVDLLAAESLDAQYKDPNSHEGTFTEPSFRDTRLDMDLSSTDGVAARVELIKRRRTCQVRPTTGHIQAAVIERGCLKTVVRRLLFAKCARIDSKDQLIHGWINARKSAGDSNAQWLKGNMVKSMAMKSPVCRRTCVGYCYSNSEDESDDDEYDYADEYEEMYMQATGR